MKTNLYEFTSMSVELPQPLDFFCGGQESTKEVYKWKLLEFESGQTDDD